MLFTLPSAISDSAAQPLNALSAIDATDEGSVTSARAEHPSNVLGPTAATPDGTTALVSAVHPLKAPSAIDVAGADCAASLATTDCNASAEIVCSPTVRT